MTMDVDTFNNNDNNNLVYYHSTKFDETAFYEIIECSQAKSTKYRVSVSIQNSVYQYVTFFIKLDDALEYVNKHQCIT